MAKVYHQLLEVNYKFLVHGRVSWIVVLELSRWVDPVMPSEPERLWRHFPKGAKSEEEKNKRRHLFVTGMIFRIPGAVTSLGIGRVTRPGVYRLATHPSFTSHPPRSFPPRPE